MKKKTIIIIIAVLVLLLLLFFLAKLIQKDSGGTITSTKNKERNIVDLVYQPDIRISSSLELSEVMDFEEK